uniref:Uncharacterized protein n=1 Tax=Amphimedon queenslandica TaxID=400682 RepID=A0A1X7UYC7_AMPQE
MAVNKLVKEKQSQKLVTILTDTHEETAGAGIADSTKRDEPCTETKPEAAIGIGDHDPITYYHQKDTLPCETLDACTPQEVSASRETSQERNENKEASPGYLIDSNETADVNLLANMEIEIGCSMLFQEARTVHSPKEPDCEYYGYTCS